MSLSGDPGSPSAPLARWHQQFSAMPEAKAVLSLIKTRKKYSRKSELAPYYGKRYRFPEVSQGLGSCRETGTYCTQKRPWMSSSLANRICNIIDNF